MKNNFAHCRKEQQVREAEAEAERIQRGMETRLNELVSSATPAKMISHMRAMSLQKSSPSESTNEWKGREAC